MYKLSIGAVCGLSWPNEKIVVQVLDDSTDRTIKVLDTPQLYYLSKRVREELLDLIFHMQKNVMAECKKYQEKGLNIKYENRANRNGYKAGALREGLQKQYVNECEYVVIFDADFQPESDFLKKTVPYLVGHDKLGMVQARWKFGKTYDTIMLIFIS